MGTKIVTTVKKTKAACRRTLGIVLVVLVCALEAGCAATDIAKSRAGIAEAEPVRDAVLFGSIGTRTERAFKSVNLGIRPVGRNTTRRPEDAVYEKRHPNTKAGLYFGYFDHAMYPQDFSDKDEKGVIYGFSLAPGDYELYMVSVGWSSMFGDYGGAAPVSIPIRVRAGEAIYLGRFTAGLTEFTEKKQWIPTDVPEKYAVDVRSEMAADLAELRKRGLADKGFRVIDHSSLACGYKPLLRCPSTRP